MRKWWPWVALAAAVVLIGVLSAGEDDTGEPLDPRSTGPLGARGLVLLLEEMGADVRIGPHGPVVESGHAVAVLLVDELGDGQRRRLEDWVDNGGTLVVADPLSDFVPALARGGGNIFAAEEPADTLRPNCALPALRGVVRIDVPNAAMYRVRDGSVGCFFGGDDQRGAYLVARPSGEGTIVALGGGAPLVNDRLDEADNAVLAVALMAPVAGTAVTVLEPDLPGSGDDSLLDLVPDSARRGLWQLGLAFVGLALWAGRRLGRPVEESQPVDIPGSELVLATGNLLHHAARRDAAAEMLRHHLRRELATRYGIPIDTPSDRLTALLAARGLDTARVMSALTPRPLADDQAFVDVAATIESIRREVTHV